jgi:hypothetical protein
MEAKSKASNSRNRHLYSNDSWEATTLLPELSIQSESPTEKYPRAA